jgi:hypothetical protein
MHLNYLRQLEDRVGSLAAADVRFEAEIEIDECLYHLIGVKDALLQEINSELHLCLAQRHVNLGTINEKLNQRGADARDITREIDDMTDEHNPLWLINELHNHSKHRDLIGQGIVNVDGRLAKASLMNPRTGEEMRTNQDKRILAVDYLQQSYTEIENLQKTVREKIHQYRKLLHPQD